MAHLCAAKKGIQGQIALALIIAHFMFFCTYSASGFLILYCETNIVVGSSLVACVEGDTGAEGVTLFAHFMLLHTHSASGFKTLHIYKVVAHLSAA